jgi:hypothetical protein
VEEPERRGVNATWPNDPDSSPENEPTAAGDPTRKVPTEDIGGTIPAQRLRTQMASRDN